MKLNNYKPLKGTGLFVFSDPGGAKAVLTFANNMLANGEVVYVISDRKYTFFENFNLIVNDVPESLDDYLSEIKPDFVLTGTSYTSKIELLFLKIANSKGIKTLSFIDHWTNLKQRFNLQDQFIYPEHILVIDQKAKVLAINEGIDVNLISVVDNPYYEFIKKFKPNISQEIFFKTIGVKIDNKKIIVYAPDPLSNINGFSKYGFDELSATKIIAELIKKMGDDFIFFIKIHPNQNIDRIKKEINFKFIIVDTNIDNNTLIYYADIVIGFFSNFLIEAMLMNKKAVRFHPVKVLEDPLEGQDIIKVIGIEKLKNIFEELLNI